MGQRTRLSSSAGSELGASSICSGSARPQTVGVGGRETGVGVDGRSRGARTLFTAVAARARGRKRCRGLAAGEATTTRQARCGSRLEDAQRALRALSCTCTGASSRGGCVAAIAALSRHASRTARACYYVQLQLRQCADRAWPPLRARRSVNKRCSACLIRHHLAYRPAAAQRRQGTRPQHINGRQHRRRSPHFCCRTAPVRSRSTLGWCS